MTHYDTLGVPKDADAATIKRAYRKKSRASHPDKGGDHAAMVAVNRAFDTLSDPEKRARYDATGEDGKPARGIDDQARDAVMQIFSALLDRLGDGDTALDAVARQLAHNLAQIRGGIAAAEKRITRLERARKRLKAKRKAARNFLDDLMADQIAQTRAKIAGAHEQVKVAERAQELLDDFAWQGEDGEQQAGKFTVFTRVEGVDMGEMLAEAIREAMEEALEHHVNGDKS